MMKTLSVGVAKVGYCKYAANCVMMLVLHIRAVYFNVMEQIAQDGGQDACRKALNKQRVAG